MLADIRNTVVPLFAEEALAFGPVATGWLLTGAALTNLAVMRHVRLVIDRGRRSVVVSGTLAMAVAVGRLAFATAPCCSWCSGYEATYVVTAGLIVLVALCALRVGETQIALAGP